MNVNTGELIPGSAYSKLSEELRDRFIWAHTQIVNQVSTEIAQVPKELEEEAAKELMEKESIFVDVEGDMPLAKWARKIREANKPTIIVDEGKSLNDLLKNIPHPDGSRAERRKKEKERRKQETKHRQRIVKMALEDERRLIR